MKSPILVVLATVAIAAPGAAQRLAYDGGVSGATGTYLFTERTNSLAFSTGFQLSTRRWSLRASLPVWVQNSTLLTASGAGVIPTGGPGGRQMVRDSGQARDQRRRAGSGGGGRQGGNGALPIPILAAVAAADPVPVPDEAMSGYQIKLSDPLLSGTVRLAAGRRIGVGIGAMVKVPLADSTTGTGAWDVGGNLSLNATIGDRWTVGVDAAYWHLGALDSLELKDPLVGSVSVGALIDTRWAGLVALTGGTRVLAGFDPPVMVSAALSRMTPGFTMGFTLGAGLTESAPDVMLGITWSVPLARWGDP
jgi:hypothetical protein